MAPRSTRSKVKQTEKNTQQTESQVEDRPQIPPSAQNPPQLLALPHKISKHARIVSFPNPVNGTSTRFLYCPESGLYEFSHIETPKNIPRSWLLTKRPLEEERGDHDEGAMTHAYIVEDSGLLLATPYDPLFLLTPVFSHRISEGASAQPMDDLLEHLSKKSKQMSFLLRQPTFRSLLQERMESVTELLDEHGVEAYKPDQSKLLAEVIRKARAMIQPTIWPQSLEQAFVQKLLDAPTVSAMSIREDESTMIGGTDEGKPSDQSNGALSNPPTEVVEQLRLRTAIDYILAKYVRPDLRRQLKLKLPSLVDFSPLDRHLEQVKKLREEAQALRDMSNNITMKRSADDDEASELRAEKRRKKEEEEKKKKQESRALKDLKKADTSGMKKLSSFFSKMTPQAAK